MKNKQHLWMFYVAPILIILLLIYIIVTDTNAICHAILTNNFKEFDDCLNCNTSINIDGVEYKYADLQKNVEIGFSEIKFDRCETLNRDGQITCYISGVLSGYRFVEEAIVVNYIGWFKPSIKSISINSEPLMAYLFLGEKYERSTLNMTLGETMKYIEADDIVDNVDDVNISHTYVYTIISGRLADVELKRNFYECSVEEIPKEIAQNADIASFRLKEIKRCHNYYFSVQSKACVHCDTYLIDENKIVIAIPEKINVLKRTDDCSRPWSRQETVSVNTNIKNPHL